MKILPTASEQGLVTKLENLGFGGSASEQLVEQLQDAGVPLSVLARVLPIIRDYVRSQVEAGRPDEAKWWEHLVGAVQPNHPEGFEPDCIYCRRIAAIRARKDGSACLYSLLDVNVPVERSEEKVSSRKGGAMKISPKMIAACKDAGACSEGLAWISAEPRTVEQLYKHNRAWFFWLMNILSKPTRAAYDAAVKSVSGACNAAVKPAIDAYDAAEKSAINAAVKLASDAYESAVKPVRDAYYAAVKSALITALRMDGYR